MRDRAILILIGLLLLVLALVPLALAEGGGGDVRASFSVSGPSLTATPTSTPRATATPTSSPSPTPTSPPTSGDIYEVDDTPPIASWISTDGMPQTHSFHDPCDMDWLKFEVVAGGTYTIITSNVISDTDTVLILYPPDILVDPYTPALAKNDDYGSGWASRIVWRASESGTHYVEVVRLLKLVPSSRYDISVEKSFQVYLPVVVNSVSETSAASP